MQIEQTIRLSVFTGVLLLVALWEIISPRRPLQDNKRRRWFTNLSLVVIDTTAVRLLFPILPVALAQVAEARGWGLFQQLDMPLWLKILLSFVILDFVIYLQHLLFHYTPILWRLHRMHHSDLDLDVTSGNRFHPLEIIISMLIKMAAIILLGAPAEAVLTFEVVLNACAMFNHGNITLPAAFDRLLRLFLVTPDMHRVHHSTIVSETNSNFGFNLPWWDRICGTYRPQPEKGHLDMTIGLKEYRDPEKLTLLRLLVQPFTSP
jgi:sterol desaturase/sphingolipid hydroxylase (fatty acid hydroxylase superfamily)